MFHQNTRFTFSFHLNKTVWNLYPNDIYLLIFQSKVGSNNDAQLKTTFRVGISIIYFRR